jgi:CheY-like chemotaxis protein
LVAASGSDDVSKERFVLLAEDDENDVTFARRSFAQAEISAPLHVVEDGQEVIDFLSGTGKYSDRDRHALPSLLMLDLKMPRKTGMEVLKWIREQERLRGLPIIIFSSSVHPAEIEAAYRIGANAFVVKPSGAPERTELARMIKGFWLTFNQTP